jgi:hypothetical protein
MDYKNNDFYQKTFGNYAKLVSKDGAKNFVPDPLLSEEKRQFVPINWSTYAETFGASSRNRT